MLFIEHGLDISSPRLAQGFINKLKEREIDYSCIDQDIKELLPKLNSFSSSLVTVQSCSGHVVNVPDAGYVLFYSSDIEKDSTKLRNLILRVSNHLIEADSHLLPQIRLESTTGLLMNPFDVEKVSKESRVIEVLRLEWWGFDYHRADIVKAFIKLL